MALSQAAASQAEEVLAAATSFFDLPRNVRDIVYQRVLIIPHPLFLLQDSPYRVESFAPERRWQWLALLKVNRQMHSEASAVLYGMNSFELVDTTKEQVVLLQGFLNQIGSVQAGFLTRICISFPVAESIDSQTGKAKLRDDGLKTLKLLQEKCTNLTTVEALIHSANSAGITRTGQNSVSAFMRQALFQIDAQLRAISSLRHIIITLYDRPISPNMIEYMQSLGWVVRPRKVPVAPGY